MIFNVTNGFSAKKSEGSLTLSAASGTINGKNQTLTFTINRVGDGLISVSSSDSSIAIATLSETTVTVTSKGYGTATITVSVAESKEYTAPIDATFTVTVDYVYLFKEGVGALVPFRCGAAGGATGSVTVNTDYIHLGVWPQSSYALTQNKVDLTETTTVYMEAKIGDTGNGALVAMSSWPSDGRPDHPSNAVAQKAFSENNVRTTYTLSLAAGSYHIGASGGVAGYIYTIYYK